MYFVIVRVLSAIAHLLFRIRVKGAEHIPKTGGIILCSNHKSVIDPLLLLIKSKRKIYYMAKSELFTDHGRLAGWFLRKAGAFPVHRGTSDTESIKTALGVLRRGDILGIFPQGGCVRENEAGFKPKAGAALIAGKARSPVLPVCIYCDGPVRLFRRITVRFGAPLSYEELGFSEGTLRESRGATKILGQKVTQLLEEQHH